MVNNVKNRMYDLLPEEWRDLIATEKEVKSLISVMLMMSFCSIAKEYFRDVFATINLIFSPLTTTLSRMILTLVSKYILKNNFFISNHIKFIIQ